MSTTIGLDPGKNGGIAWIRDGSPCVEKMPETLKDLWELLTLDILRNETIGMTVAYIEDVHVAPSQEKSEDGKPNKHRMGARSAFTFGRGYGNLEAFLTAAGIPIMERVSPQKWQKAMNCMTKGDKNVSKRRAQELYPQLKVTHATADALLIATYGTRQP